MQILDWPYAAQAAFWFVVLSAGGSVIGIASKQIRTSIRRRDD